MPFGLNCPIRHATLGILAAALALAHSSAASAEALLLVEAESGKVLQAENATYPWYPASLTKLMTTYVTLRAIKERRITANTLITVSERAAAQQPSKMGFKPGTELTIDNALKMLMVKSANDMAVAIAEGVSGSIEGFAGEMNAAAQRLGMTQSQFVNPNGLPDDRQITSARDMAILARAMIQEFPEYDLYWRIPAIKFGKRVLRNYNRLIDRYPGADGMKTGFICASGFNLVASATRNGKQLIAVVLGAPSSPVRAQKAAQLLESGFNSTGTLSWLTPSLGTVGSLKPISATPPNLYDSTCGKHRRRPAAESDTEEANATDTDGIVLSSLRTPYAKSAALLGPLTPSMPPIDVFVGRPKGQSQPTQLAAVPLPPRPPEGAARQLNKTAPTVGTALTLAATGIPVSTFNVAALSSNPPASFAPIKRTDAVPLPRSRPQVKRKAKRTKQARVRKKRDK